MTNENLETNNYEKLLFDQRQLRRPATTTKNNFLTNENLGDIVGRYERNIMSPSIEVIIKMADALDVSIDYLVGKTNLQLDKNTLERLEDIGKLNDDARQYIFNHLDLMIRDFKTKKAYAR